MTIKDLSFCFLYRSWVLGSRNLLSKPKIGMIVFMQMANSVDVGISILSVSEYAEGKEKNGNGLHLPVLG